MPRKSFEAGMEAGAKPFEEKFKKQADAIEKVGQRMDSRLDEISGVMDVMIEDLSAQERKRVYDLNTVVDISELDKTEKDYLCAIVYALASLNSDLSKEQKDYLRALKAYLMITNVQTDVNLASIENIDNITTQKAIMQTIMEFLFLEYESHDYMDDYEDIFDYFSVNRKGIREIQDGIDTMYETVGIIGIANHYSFLAGLSDQADDVPDAKEDSMLAKAEQAYLTFDMKNAFSLFSYLAEQGNGRACYFLGEIYTNNYGNVVGRKDKTEAKKWRNIGAERGDVLSKLNCAFSTDDEKEKSAILSAMFPDVLALARQGDVFSMNEVADMFAYGYGTTKDEGSADYWSEESAKGGYWRSLNKLGIKYGNAEQYDKAIDYYSQAAETGYEAAKYNLGVLYADGQGVAKDGKKAFELYLAAAEQGYPSAQLWVGVAYDFKYEEFGVTQNMVEAEKWYRLAADNDNASACWNLAMLIYSDSSMRDDEEVLPYLIKASALGHERATIEMACWLCANKGISEKMLKEFGEREWKETTTFLGGLWDAFTSADVRVGELKKRGEKILQKYAEDGNIKAQYYLGVLYSDNMYLGKDKDLARKWLKKAYGQGNIRFDIAYETVKKPIWVLGPSLTYFS